METGRGNTPKLGKIQVVIGDEEETLDLDKIVPIDADLSDEFARQPSLYAYVAMLAAQCESLYRGAQASTERTKARVDQTIREDAKALQEKVTENIVEKRVMLSAEVEEAEDTEAGYRYQYLMLRAVVASLDQRAQMLISLGAHLRAESEQTGMLIRDTKARLDNARQGKLS